MPIWGPDPTPIDKLAFSLASVRATILISQSPGFFVVAFGNVFDNSRSGDEAGCILFVV